MQEQEFTLGKTTFWPNFRTEVYPRLHPNNIDLIVRSDKWQVTLNTSWILIFPSIKETETKNLIVMYPYCFEVSPPPVLDLIRNSSFKFLLKLELDKNNILNIQSLGSVDMDNLETLCLSHNFITNLKPINKAKFPHLEKIYIQDNKCYSIEISRAKTKSSLASLKISYESVERVKLEDPRTLVRLQAQVIKQLYISSNSRRILKENVKDMLGERFKSTRTNWQRTNDRNQPM